MKDYMEIIYNLTDHKWDRSDQWNKFLEELAEFVVEIEVYNKGLGNPVKLVDEGFDSIKALLKCDDENNKIILSTINIEQNTLKQFFHSFHKRANLIDKENKNFSHSYYIIAATEYLFKFCIHHDLDFHKLLKLNDEKNIKKGTKEKLYLDIEEKAFLLGLIDKVEYSDKEKLAYILDKIEK